MMVKAAPASFSMAALRSPVCAPDFSGWQSWPPAVTGPPASRDATSRRIVAGGAMAISQASAAPASAARAAISEASARPSAARPFIFQLPAISGRRG
jgi:hypothetical protein